jgi:surfactin synthase thioesterase subunit
VSSLSSAVPDTHNPNPWYVYPRANPDAEIRLFFFPYAGGGPAAFSKWLNELPGDMEGYIAHYPGRGSRYREPPINCLTILVEGLYQAIQSLLDKPFAFFGHSLGGLAAFELSRQLWQQNLPQPQILFISACGAPHLPDPHPPIHTLPDAEFIKALKKLNGIPTEVANHSELMELLLPTLRADFQIVESYQYTPNNPPLNIPIIAFGGLDDQRVIKEHLEGWALYTISRFESHYFPGDHFFINTARESIIDFIATELSSSHAKG